MSSYGFVVMAVFAGSAAVGAGRKVLERRRARKALRARPALDGSSPEGEVVRVTGVVCAGEQTLVGPLTGQTCVVVRSRVTYSRSWTMRRATRPNETLSMVPFVLDVPGRGRVMIEGEHALLDLPPAKLPADLGRKEMFAVRHGVPVKSASVAIYEEVLVAPGMNVAIAGLMMKDLAEAPPDGERGFRDAPETTLRLAGNADHPIVIGEPV